MDRFFGTSIITGLPFRNLGRKNHFQRKLGQTRFDIPGGSSPVTGKYISPVTLGIYQKIFLPYLYQGIANRSVTMRVVLHGLPDDIGHFVVTSILHFTHGMQDTSLHRLKAVIKGRNRPFQYYVRSIIQKIILIHPRNAGDGSLFGPG